MNPFVYVVILLLILVNALYVAAEFSAVSVRRSRVQQKVEEGNWLAIQLFPYIENGFKLDRYIATCQIGITISSLVLGAYGQATLAPLFIPLFENLGGMQDVAAQSASAIVVLVILTAAQMILGELVPKSLALQFPTQLALYTVVPMRWSIKGLSWFIGMLNGTGVAILRLLGVRDTGHRHIHSPEELDYLIAESRDGGMLEADEHARLRSALRLSVTTVEEIMVPRTRIRAIEAGTPFPEVLRMAAESPYTRLPVYEGTLDRVVGYIHIQDVARRALDEGTVLPIRPVLFLLETLTLERVLERLREERQHLALITDEHGGLSGLATVGDILDEILGGVADEFKAADTAPEMLTDGRLRLPGSMRLEEATTHLGVEWIGESSTLGGFVMERLGRLPRAGELIVINDVSLEIERMSGRTVASILARPKKRPEGEA